MRSRLVMASALAAISATMPLASYDADGDTRLIVRNKTTPRSDSDSAERMAAAERKRQRKNARRLLLAQTGDSHAE